MISNGELSDPLCDSVNRGLTLVKLGHFYVSIVQRANRKSLLGKHAASQLQSLCSLSFDDIIIL